MSREARDLGELLRSKPEEGAVVRSLSGDEGRLRLFGSLLGLIFSLQLITLSLSRSANRMVEWISGFGDEFWIVGCRKDKKI